MKLTNRLNLPQPIVDAVANDEYTRGGADISVTQLIDPPRKIELIRRHDDELEEDVADRIFALFGQAIHTVLERANREGDVENRLYAKVGDWTISGQYDRIALVSNKADEVVMQDYKTAKMREITHGIKPERALQLNVLAWLAKLHGHRIDAIEDIFILRDWSKVRASKGDGYPPKQVVVVPMSLWTMEQAEAYVTERVELHKAVREGRIELPECSSEERWQDPDKYAVMKPGLRRALKLYQWEAEAVAHINQKKVEGGYVERRQSESLRCAYYCAAAAVCDQWARIKPEVAGEAESEE